MISRVLSTIRRNGVAWLALFVALGGTSLAASHYIITSTKQIKPSVLTALHGARGARGATGGAGPEGPKGKEGQEGLRGKEGPTGPVGNTGLKGETGDRGEKGAEGKPGNDGKNGLNGEKGERGERGEKGEEGTARAYARVEESGVVTESKGFENAAKTFENPKKEGIYCVHGLSGPLHNVTVTVDDRVHSEPYFATATLGRSEFAAKEGLCSTETQITVEVWLASTTKTVNAPFFIAVN